MEESVEEVAQGIQRLTVQETDMSRQSNSSSPPGAHRPAVLGVQPFSEEDTDRGQVRPPNVPPECTFHNGFWIRPCRPQPPVFVHTGFKLAARPGGGYACIATFLFGTSYHGGG